MAVFSHGVASGDPTPEGVVLWTRVSPQPDTRAVTVQWRVARDPQLDDVVAEGEAHASPDHDFTVKVDVGGLEPATTYHYGFGCEGSSSPVGRTRTAPEGSTERVRLGVVSCACWTHGFFNAYRRLAERDVDAVVHLGDYVYENGDSWDEVGRTHEPRHRLRSLRDYRMRHAQYRTDPDLQLLHRRHPVVAVWDDHDVAGNAWRDGAGDHDPARDGDWGERRAAATQAFLEWLPVRVPDPSQPDRIYRTVTFGDLADLVVVDTRLVGRDEPSADGQRAVPLVGERRRSLLGEPQRAWLREELRRSSTRWRLLGSQVMMAPLRAVQLPPGLRRLLPGLVAGGAGVNAGQWDGYPAERESLLALLRDEHIANVVVLSGDIHSSWAAELAGPSKEGSETNGTVAVEFVVPSVTSRSFAEEATPPFPGSRRVVRHLIARFNRHVRFFDLEGHGYVVVDVDRDHVQAQWWHVDTVARRGAGERLVASWSVRDGEAALVSD